MKAELSIRATSPADRAWIKDLMDRDWGGEPLIVRSKAYYPSALEGLFIVDQQDTVKGFLFYDIVGQDCEIVVFEIFEKFKGLGTRVLHKLKEIAIQRGCRRIFLMTHNDNLDALRFYQRRGFQICKIYINSMENVRKLKPCIGLVGDYNIPIRDEIDLEMLIE